MMNKDQLRKLASQYVKLRPPAKSSRGQVCDDDWFVLSVEEDFLRLHNQKSLELLNLGFDHIHNYTTDRTRGGGLPIYGFLSLHSQVSLKDGTATAEPLPPPRATGPSPNPLDAQAARLAEEQYRALGTNARAAVARLLVAGDATGQEVSQVLLSIGFMHSGDVDILAQIASTAQLVQRVEVSETKETRLLGYRGRYTINPRFRSALEHCVADDEEVLRVMSKWR